MGGALFKLYLVICLLSSQGSGNGGIQASRKTISYLSDLHGLFYYFCLHLLPNFAPSIIQVCILGGKNILCIHCTEREDWPEWVKWIKYELDECWIIHILSLNINSDMRVLISKATSENHCAYFYCTVFIEYMMSLCIQFR